MTNQEKEALLKRIYSLPTEWADGGGEGFEVGKLYAVLGWNNGRHIMSESINGDTVDNTAYDCMDGTIFTDDGAVFKSVPWKVRNVRKWYERKKERAMMRRT